MKTKKIEKKWTEEVRTIRFTNFVDETSLRFEQEARETLPEAALEQHLIYVSHTKREFYLLQIRSEDQKPAAQIAVFIGRSKLLPFFAMASVPNFGQARNPQEESFSLKALAETMKGIPGVMTLRLQPQRFETESLSDFQNRAERLDYFQSKPVGPVRTLLIDLLANPETLLAALPQKTRAKIRQAAKVDAKVLELTNESTMKVCEDAMNESRRRSGASSADFDFSAPFEIGRTNGKSAKVLGLFLGTEIEKPLAYVIGYCTGKRAEFSSAGAFGDPALRAIPYNYFLLWELMNWARAQGAEVMDLGGITDGGADDPLQGIARFKRSFTSVEIEIGREMVKVIRPLRFAVYASMKQILSGFRWENPVSIPANTSGKPMRMMPSYD
jgi:lipid II:glycine glycyltransferase (peptidoglycan interpeptide bridge formation enzyme)